MRIEMFAYDRLNITYRWPEQLVPFQSKYNSNKDEMVVDSFLQPRFMQFC